MCSSSSSRDEIDLHKLTIYGFTRNNDFEVPDSIVELIISYYPSKYLIYAIGEDRTGFFGLGCIKQLDTFEKLPSWTYFCDSPHFIYHGLNRFILKTKFNRIYCSGRNEMGELGLGLKDEKIMIFKEMKTNFLKPKKHKKNNKYIDNIKLISNGKEAYHTFLVTKKNKFYAFGRNEYGQFGNYKKSKSNINAPKLMFNKTKHIFNWNNNNNINIVQIECGESHTIFLSSNGKLYSCGNNNYNQCGILINNNNNNNNKNESSRNSQIYKQQCILRPTLIKFENNNIFIINIKCGSFHNLCIDSHNILYVFGSNEMGQLGMNHRTYIGTPEKQNYLLKYKICKIECGSNHSLCITNNLNGYAYLFGDNEYGQCAADNNKYKVITKPKLFQSIRVKKQIIQNENNNNNNNNNNISPHSISHSNNSVSQSHTIHTIGNGYHLNNDENKSNNISSTIQSSPTSSTIPTLPFFSFSPSSKSSKSHTFTIDENNNNNNNKRIFKNIKIYSGSLSDLHSVLLTYDNNIITFGSNYRNECSHLKQNNFIQQPQILNKKDIGIDENLQIDSVVAAGSATLLICLPQ